MSAYAEVSCHHETPAVKKKQQRFTKICVFLFQKSAKLPIFEGKPNIAKKIFITYLFT